MTKIYIVRSNTARFLTSSFIENYLLDNDICYTTNPFAADIFLSLSASFRLYTVLRKLFPSKKTIVWTNEPRLNSLFKDFKTPQQVVMNVYSGNVFLHNLHFLGSYHVDFTNNLGINLEAPPSNTLTIEQLAAKPNYCAAIFSYRDPHCAPLMHDGKNIDLFAARQELAYFLYTKGKADILGSNWPGSVAVRESSGYESGNSIWWETKLKLLRDYKFSLCFENTAYPHYCTEKIWHAIASGCLPIYYGKGTAIYETFPPASFIDAAEFGTPEELLYFLESLAPAEHIRRYNTCLAVMQRSCAQRLANPRLKTDVLDALIGTVRELMGQPTAG